MERVTDMDGKSRYAGLSQAFGLVVKHRRQPAIGNALGGAQAKKQRLGLAEDDGFKRDKGRIVKRKAGAVKYNLVKYGKATQYPFIAGLFEIGY